MKSKLLIAALAVTLSSQTWAAVTIGDPDCAQWTKGQSRPVLLNQPDRAWALGVLTGLNQNNFYKNALRKISSAEQVWRWMDSYCKDNPLSNVTEGANKLMMELVNK
jgi:hypothetical protein